MIKNILALVALIGLIIWGVYDTGRTDPGLSLESEQ